MAKTCFVPSTLGGALSCADWLDSPWWPLEQGNLRTRCVRPLRQVSLIARHAEPELQPILNLITPAVSGWGASLVEAALLLSKNVPGDENLLLQSFFDIEKKAQFISGLQPKQNRAMSTAEVSLRNIFRTASWSSPKTFLENVFSSEITALTHNPLLVETAKHYKKAVSFQHGDIFLQKALVRFQNRKSQAAAEVASILSKALIETEGLPEELTSKHKTLFFDMVYSFASRAERDLFMLGKEMLPQHVWTGTFGKWSSRAIGLAVMSNGGSVTAFDHGGGVGNVYDVDHFRQEVSAGASFLASSPRAAQLIREELVGPDVSSDQILCGSGDPSFKKFTQKLRKRNVRSKTAVYSTTIFRGYRQFSPALLPDPIYLIWQKKVLSCLGGMPVHSLFKPAPEGLLVNQPHPLGNSFNTSYKPFEEHMEDCDIFIFDYAHTTTFWKALCSDATVVLFDLGVNALSPFMKKMINERATIINVDFGQDGVPILNEEEFYHAVMTSELSDPIFFRKLICAD